MRTVYAGSADFYARGRLPYPASLGEVLATAVGSGDRIVDVGCGPGTLTARIAEHFDEVVGVDQELSMVRHAARSWSRWTTSGSFALAPSSFRSIRRRSVSP